MSDETLGPVLDMMYESMDGNEVAMDYSRRHGIESAMILTVKDDEMADLVAEFLADQVRGKTVVEIGAGIGLLALHLSQYAKRIYAIEANPSWTSTFLACLYAHKPKHVSWLFGSADEFAGGIRGDVALFCTHSDHAGMKRAASLFAPEVIDVYEDLFGAEEYRAKVEAILKGRLA